VLDFGPIHLGRFIPMEAPSIYPSEGLINVVISALVEPAPTSVGSMVRIQNPFKLFLDISFCLV
jgi:hypothetical protein